MNRSFICAFLVLGVSACQPASPLVDTSDVREATLAEVADCTPLSVLTTTTGVSGSIAQDKALEIARNETKANAQNAGGNTIVFENGAAGSDDLFVRGTAYRC